ncbi:aldehyde dehydrogenase family protein [Neomegalonema sp.]|uniref:aldehyde dehydrogenase family protein n=1 Tax=Neomegalonema sp. TaxID=2039713 RepID=UPI0026255BC6|nr:aldehyde dehydrogenase family protein [Neomegalonema sp.]MDD2868679.1 aldehyde dehydrogenase family protein [Neomegalonema sp.]
MTTILTCVSPVDGSVYAERPAASRAEAEAAVARARKAQAAWAARPLAERVALVSRGIEILGERNAEIVPELARQMGRPTRYGGEYGGVRDRTAYMAEIAAATLAPIEIEESAKFIRRIRREPHGVVLVVAPWNYPFLTAINTVVPALMAGNVVILKPATQTLLTGARIVEALHAGGVPEDVVQNLYLDHETTSGLIAARAFDFVNFTGSVAGGQAMERAAAGTFTPLGLELGGKDPGYVMADANLDAAVETLIDGAMYNAGQCCCGIERIYVHESLYGDFLEKAVALTRGYKLGNPLDQATTLGPMANRRFSDLVRAQTAEAVAAGAKAHVPTMAEDDGGVYLTPQILTQVNHDMRVMREESFGPVVGIMPVSGDEEALRLMNDSAYGLTVSLWTQDPERAQRLGALLETGTVFMNRADYLDPALVWTGRKDTGRGGALSVIGYHNLTRPKSYHLKRL